MAAYGGTVSLRDRLHGHLLLEGILYLSNYNISLKHTEM